MHRLVTKLESHIPSDAQEADDRDKVLGLLNAQGSACLYRDLYSPGHITASALLISKDGQRVLMNHHKFLQKWLCFGGHVDGTFDVLSAAKKEVEEECGIRDFTPVSEGIFDIDIHPIPENDVKNEPAHTHFDIRFLFQANDNEDFIVSSESTELRWCTADEALRLVAPYAQSRMCRMIEKWKKMQG